MEDLSAITDNTIENVDQERPLLCTQLGPTKFTG